MKPRGAKMISSKKPDVASNAFEPVFGDVRRKIHQGNEDARTIGRAM